MISVTYLTEKQARAAKLAIRGGCTCKPCTCRNCAC